MSIVGSDPCSQYGTILSFEDRLWDPMGDQRLYDKLLQSVTCFEDSARLGHPAVRLRRIRPHEPD